MSTRETMKSFQHGEVYVLNDGAETDLDRDITSAHQLRSLRHNNLPSGQVYESFILKESAAIYRQNRQVFASRDRRESKIGFARYQTNRNTTLSITEIGGTTGD